MQVRTLSRRHRVAIAMLLVCALSAPAATLQGTAYTELRVEGMTDVASVARVQRALLQVPGVIAADVDLEESLAAIQLDVSALPSQATLIAAIEAAGFRAASSVGREYRAHAVGAVPPTPADSVSLESAPATSETFRLHPLSRDARELKQRFNADADKLRLVMLLSPT